MSASGQNDPRLGSRNEAGWLAYELHDGLLQWIISARMNIENVASQLSKLGAAPEAIQRQVVQTQRFLEEAIDEGRLLIKFLDDQAHDEPSPLATELYRFLDLIEVDAEAAGQRIVFESVPEDWPQLSAPQAWNVLRILQQAIGNAIRHAGPCEIRLRCDMLDARLCRIVVADTGAGFDRESFRSEVDHFGLPGMEHRARLMGGSLDIASAPGKGTVLTLVIPLVESV